MNKRILNHIKDKDFLRHNLVFFIGSLIIAGINYIFYPVLGHFLTVSYFGEAQAVISIFIQFSIFITAFGYVVTNIINNEKSSQSSTVVIIELERICLLASILLLILLTVFSTYIKHMLHLSSEIPIALVGLATLISIPLAARNFILQGLRRLGEVSVAGIIFALGKMAIAVILILLGLNITGVMLGYVLAQSISVAYLSKRLSGRYPRALDCWSVYKNNALTKSQGKTIKKEFIYGGIIVALLFAITILYSFDVVIARMILSSKDAGIYSGVSVISRIAYYVTASVAGVLIASVKIQDSVRTAQKTLFKSFLIVLAVGGIVTAVFSINPERVVELLIGKKYIGMSGFLPIMSLSMLICSWNNLFVCFHIARRQYKVIIATTIGLAVMGVYILINHSGYNDIVLGYLAANMVTFTILLLQTFLAKYDKVEPVKARS